MKAKILVLFIGLSLLVSFNFAQAQVTDTTLDLETLAQTLRQQIEDLRERILQLQEELKGITTELKETEKVVKFTQNLRKGLKSKEVERLQEFLSKYPEIYPEGLVTGYFGSLTEGAVKKFQEKHSDDVLKPYGLNKGTGFVGEKTIAKINELLTEGAGASGQVPPGLTTAPGIQKKVATTTESERKITICHYPPDNPDARHTIEIAESALEAHLAHGDTIGACEDEPELEPEPVDVCSNIDGVQETIPAGMIHDGEGNCVEPEPEAVLDCTDEAATNYNPEATEDDGSCVYLDTTSPANITNFTAVAGDGQIDLSWTNPTDDDFAGTKILRKIGDYPVDVTDGTQVYSGIDASCIDIGLTNGTVYYYKAFTHDEVPNYSSGVEASAEPAAPPTTPVCEGVACPVCQYCVEGDCVNRSDGYNNCGFGCQRCVIGVCQDYDAACSNCQYCTSDDCVDYCAGMDANCGCTDCVNCNNSDGCFGNSYLDYFCSGAFCDYTSDDCSDCSCSCGGYNQEESIEQENCEDGKDNDCDGVTDLEDSECVPGQVADTIPPADVTNFTAAVDEQVNLSWINPTDDDFAGVKIIRRTGIYPVDVTDGTQVYDGTGTSYTDTDLSCETAYYYYYKTFTYDEVPNYSSGVGISPIPIDIDSAPQFLWKQGSYGSSDGQFKYPHDIAVDASGNIYVADAENHRIQKFASDGEFITKWGSEGTGDGQFKVPVGIAIDANGNVYVTEREGGRVQKFTSDGTFIIKWGSVGSGDGRFFAPYGIAIDAAGDVYVVDRSNHRVQKFTSDGTFILKWGSKGTGDGYFNLPTGIAIDENGNIYVVGGGLNYRVQKFTSDGTFILKWGSEGCSNGEFSSARFIDIDSSGDVYVADRNNHRVQKFTSDGTFILKWGYYGRGEGQFIYSWGIAIDADNNIYVADGHNHRIQKFAPTSAVVLEQNQQLSLVERLLKNIQSQVAAISTAISEVFE